eukprot:2550645-Pyramimonas_sp.AAC.1
MQDADYPDKICDELELPLFSRARVRTRRGALGLAHLDRRELYRGAPYSEKSGTKSWMGFCFATCPQ